MEFKNLTPFDGLAFSSFDTQDRPYHVVAMKVGYQLVHVEGARWTAQLMESDPLSLCLADEHWGDPVASSLREESDLAPYKPRCDVLVRGHAHAPGGQPARDWTVHLRLLQTRQDEVPEPSRPVPLNPVIGLTPTQLAQWESDKRAFQHLVRVAKARPPRTVIDKQLRVMGPSHFVRTPLIGWSRTTSEAVDKVALRWEHSFGGACHVPADDAAQPLLNEVCFSNPLGKGWLDARWEQALHKAKLTWPKELPAPQIVGQNGSDLQAPVFEQHPEGEQDARQMRMIAARYRAQPAGFAPLGRAWAPRLALAGTYDEKWLQERHPYLPKDFDFGYYNCAPADQQIPFPDLTEGYELHTLGLTPGGGALRVLLPPHRSLVLADLGGARLPLPMQVDTITLNTDAMQLSIVWRTACLKSLEPESLELRFKSEPSAPWVSYFPLDEVGQSEPAPGVSA